MGPLLGSGGQPSHVAILAGGEEGGQPFPRLGAEACLAEPDCVEAKRKRAIADQRPGRNRRFAQDVIPGLASAGSGCWHRAV
jgi:hypothetical protein